MTSAEIERAIGVLQADQKILQARVAALTAFAGAILESNPRRDELLTRWGHLLGPALHQFADLEKLSSDAGSFIPFWVDTFPSANREKNSK
ncbi:hypothetical protein [Comamonas odontotermitis]|uniref:hypothetical protein n=1 Tax=Comamonas odontotermitis TaxID=379895 RepID=UPI003753C969